jgi:Ca-activated chloride channel family protein
MTRILTLSLLILAAVADGFSQSGRRVDPAPSPSPTVIEAPLDYSESTPARPRPADDRKHASTERTRADNAASGMPSIENGEGVIKVETDLVTVPVSVFDRNGLYIPNLQRSDFRIFEDGVEQEIAYFGTVDKPFTVILLLDTSLSTNYKIEEIRRAAIAFVDQLKSQDAVMVVEFDRDVHVLTEATNDRSRIYKAIGKADFGSGTSIYDAVYFSLRKRLNKIRGRKAIVLFTDGVDTTSEKAGYDTTLTAAEEADAMVFPIYYNTFDWNNSGGGSMLLNQSGTSAEEYALGRKYLNELAEYTGGRVFRPEAVPGGLTAAFEAIAEELRRQYNIGYIPNNSGSPGERKQIRVRVNRPNLVLRARDSYIVGASRKPAS